MNCFPEKKFCLTLKSFLFFWPLLLVKKNAYRVEILFERASYFSPYCSRNISKIYTKYVYQQNTGSWKSEFSLRIDFNSLWVWRLKHKWSAHLGKVWLLKRLPPKCCAKICRRQFIVNRKNPFFSRGFKFTTLAFNF